MTLSSPALADARIIIPVRNGGERWREVAQALRRLVPTPAMVVVVDSRSVDGSDIVAVDLGFEVTRIDPRTFNHGRTRQEAVDRFCKGVSYVVFLTHDAILEGHQSLTELLSAFDDPHTGAAYGRQLPHYNARPFAKHMAAYLYPEQNITRGLSDAALYGLRTTHLSNSFAAYRLKALYECGGFPATMILGEDAYVALRMLRSGWTISYRASATVRHSHDYSLREELQRYFDYGVFHAQAPDIIDFLGSAEGEGMRFVKSELRFVSASTPWLLPLVPARNAARYIGYRLGRHFRQLPNFVRRRLSMTRGFWETAEIQNA